MNTVKSLLADDHESLGHLLTSIDVELSDANLSRAFESLDLFWARLAVHIRAEHLQLFPVIENATHLSSPHLPDFAETITTLRLDHDFFMKELGGAVRTVRRLMNLESIDQSEIERLRQQMVVIGERLKSHNRLEEEVAYVWPSLLFDEQTILKLHDRLKHELENLPPRFN